MKQTRVKLVVLALSGAVFLSGGGMLSASALSVAPPSPLETLSTPAVVQDDWTSVTGENSLSQEYFGGWGLVPAETTDADTPFINSAVRLARLAGQEINVSNAKMGSQFTRDWRGTTSWTNVYIAPNPDLPPLLMRNANGEFGVVIFMTDRKNVNCYYDPKTETCPVQTKTPEFIPSYEYRPTGSTWNSVPPVFSNYSTFVVTFAANQKNPNVPAGTAMNVVSQVYVTPGLLGGYGNYTKVESRNSDTFVREMAPYNYYPSAKAIYQTHLNNGPDRDQCVIAMGTEYGYNATQRAECVDPATERCRVAQLAPALLKDLGFYGCSIT